MSATNSAKRKRRRILGISSDATSISTIPKIGLGQLLRPGSVSTSSSSVDEKRPTCQNRSHDGAADVTTSRGCDTSPKVLQNVDSNNGSGHQISPWRQRDPDDSLTNKSDALESKKHGEATKSAISQMNKSVKKSNNDRVFQNVIDLAERRHIVFLEGEISRLQAENKAKDKEIRCLKGAISCIKTLLDPINTTMESSKSSLSHPLAKEPRSSKTNTVDYCSEKITADSGAEMGNHGESELEESQCMDVEKNVQPSFRGVSTDEESRNSYVPSFTGHHNEGSAECTVGAGTQQIAKCEDRRFMGVENVQPPPLRAATNIHNPHVSSLMQRGMPSSPIPMHPFMDMSPQNNQLSVPTNQPPIVNKNKNIDSSLSEKSVKHEVTTEMGLGICVPYPELYPTKFNGDMGTERNRVLPDFIEMINFPHFRLQKRIDSESHGANCVMCGTWCNTSSKKGKGKTRCAPTIPVQNKHVCSNCDTKVWVVTKSKTQIKWCKGCKNFRTWACFGMKGESSKCENCRKRARASYQEKKKKINNLEPARNQDGSVVEESVKTSPGKCVNATVCVDAVVVTNWKEE